MTRPLIESNCLLCICMLLLVGTSIFSIRCIVREIIDGASNLSIDEMMDGLPFNDSRLTRHIMNKRLIPPYYFQIPDMPGQHLISHVYSTPIKRNGVLDQFLDDMDRGFFIEYGANDQTNASFPDTVILQKDQNWTGLLMHPNPATFSRMIEHNKRVWKCNCCLSPDKYSRNMDFMYKVVDENNSSSWRKIPVPCFPLMSILSALQIFTVDYFYLNAFGHELQILQNVAWDEVEIKILCVSHAFVPEGSEILQEYMKSKNYYALDTLDDSTHFIFLHESLMLYNEVLV